MSYTFGALASRGGGGGAFDPLTASDAELEAYLRGSGFHDLDTAIAWQWGDPLPQWSVDLAVGAGDGAWNAITFPARLFTDNPASLGDVRGLMGIDGGIGYDSLAYRSSYVGGNVVGGVALYGGAATYLGPGGQVIGHPAYGGRTMSILRSGKIRFGWSRNNGPTLRLGVKNRHYDLVRRPPPRQLPPGQ